MLVLTLQTEMQLVEPNEEFARAGVLEPAGTRWGARLARLPRRSRRHARQWMLPPTSKQAEAIAALLRFTSPAQSTARYATCDMVVAGVMVRQNDPIVTLMAAANRDPEVFECPDELVLNRSPNPHLSFGASVGDGGRFSPA